MFTTPTRSGRPTPFGATKQTNAAIDSDSDSSVGIQCSFAPLDMDPLVNGTPEILWSQLKGAFSDVVTKVWSKVECANLDKLLDPSPSSRAKQHTGSIPSSSTSLPSSSSPSPSSSSTHLGDDGMGEVNLVKNTTHTVNNDVRDTLTPKSTTSYKLNANSVEFIPQDITNCVEGSFYDESFLEQELRSRESMNPLCGREDWENFWSSPPSSQTIDVTGGSAYAYVVPNVDTTGYDLNSIFWREETNVQKSAHETVESVLNDCTNPARNDFGDGFKEGCKGFGSENMTMMSLGEEEVDENMGWSMDGQAVNNGMSTTDMECMWNCGRDGLENQTGPATLYVNWDSVYMGESEPPRVARRLNLDQNLVR